MKRIALFILLFTLFIITQAQEKKKKFDFKFYGYVNTLFTYDTRQVVAAREDHILLYPENIKEKDGKDINDNHQFNIGVIQTRFGAKIAGPNLWGAKTNGVIEAEFIGNSEADVNGLRVRHAFMNFNWGKNSLLIGQTWSPFFTTECFPTQVGANTGLPTQAFSRNPQVRYTFKNNGFKFEAAILTQRDYTSRGPKSSADFNLMKSNSFLRNAALPITQAKVVYTGKKGSLIGLVGETKTIKPLIDIDETHTSFGVSAFAKLNLNPITIKAKTTYGSNLADYLMLGGYAFKDANDVSYTQIYQHASWLDIEYNTGKFTYGIYAGFNKNLGSDDKIKFGENNAAEKKTIPYVYALGGNIDKLYRIAPRVRYAVKNVKFELELENTTAYYGTVDEKGKVKDTKDVTNYRTSLSVYYTF